MSVSPFLPGVLIRAVSHQFRPEVMRAVQTKHEELDHGGDTEGRLHSSRSRRDLPPNVRRSRFSVMAQVVAPPLHHQLHLQHLQLAQLPQPPLRLDLYPPWIS